MGRLDIELPPLDQMQSVTGVVWLAEAWAIHSKWLRERPGDYTEATRRKVMAGAFLTAGDYVHAQQGRLKMIDAVDSAFRRTGRHDVYRSLPSRPLYS